MIKPASWAPFCSLYCTASYPLFSILDRQVHKWAQKSLFSAYSDVEVKGNGQEEWTLQIGGYRPFEYDSPSGPKSAVAHSADFPWKRAYVYISEPMTYTGDIIIEAVGSSHGEFYISSAAPVTATQGLTDSDLRDFLRATMFVVGGWFLWILTNHVLLSLKKLMTW
ncbi:MAG: hypothetical protein UZ21_OP11001001026 [Microgenomates bacterium OLB22]|nr:MAG: hypothetical protein UZ21_OP11001001026 [Microgenomates bacterium OLB22]